MNILVVDDTKNIRLLLTKCLEMDGYRVRVAGDGVTALSLFASERFDLAFLDIKMPQFSGTEVLRKIREMGIDTPVIIITAYATVKNAVECTNLGAVAYLQKPFTADKIRSVMEEVLSHGAGVRDFESLLARAADQAAAGKLKEAERLLKSALAEHSLNPELNRRLSEVSRALGKEADAEKYEAVSRALES